MYCDFHEWIATISMIKLSFRQNTVMTVRIDMWHNGDLVIPKSVNFTRKADKMFLPKPQNLKTEESSWFLVYPVPN
jgi:hypothetical protein